MKLRLLLITALILLASSAFAADLTGTWQVAITASRPNGTVETDKGIAVLKQNGDQITGTMGPDESRQTPIAEGTIKDNKVVLKMQQRPDRTMTFELTINGEKLVGTGERTGDPQKATVELVKSSPK